MLPLFNYLLWTFWCFYKLNNPTNWCFHTYFVTSYINTFLCLFPTAFICSKLWNMLASALFQIGNNLTESIWPDIKALSVCPQLRSLCISPTSGSLLTCSFPRLFPNALSDESSLLRGHLPPRLLNSLQGPSSPASRKPVHIFPHPSASPMSHNCPPKPLLQGRNHLNPCNKMFSIWHISQC